MSEGCRVVILLEDGTRLPPLEGRMAEMVLSLWTNRDEINRLETGFVEFAFQGKKLHPVRITGSFPNLPRPHRYPQSDPHAG